MEAHSKRNIQSGERYTHLFPVANKATTTIRKNANVYDTVAFIPKVVGETLSQTERLAAMLKGDTIFSTCRNIWEFVYKHIAYKKDKDGYEQIRSPARAWHDRFSGVDCDCYSVFISSVLSNLNIPHTLRITKYNHNYFQHIYPIVPTTTGYIILDCVTEKFNYEVPFSEKKDYPMDLEYLNGFDGVATLYSDPNDLHHMRTGDGMQDLGKIIQQRFSAQRKNPMQKTMIKQPIKKAANKSTAQPVNKKEKGFKKVLNTTNKVNPATVLLRNGILASMKLNIKNVAGRLRWSYLSPNEAINKGIIPEKFQKLIVTRQRLENIFYKAGGKPDNLRKAILSGKGNRDKAVNGIDGLEGIDGMIDYMNEYTPLDQLLGTDINFSENIEGMEGLGELGEPITLASIAAASGVVAGIVGMLKQVGDIFQKKSKQSADFDAVKNEQAANEPTPKVDVANTIPMMPVTTTEPMEIVKEQINEQAKEQVFLPTSQEKFSPAMVNNELPAVIENDSNEAMMNNKLATTTTALEERNANEQPEGFWNKNKKWLKPAAIGIGGISILAIAAKMFGGKSKTQNKASPKATGLKGIPKAKPKKNHRPKPQSTSQKKSAVALM